METLPTAVPASPPTTAVPRLHFIDGLRGLAMLMVLLYHCWLFGGKWAVGPTLAGHSLNIAPVLGFGHIGVNLFLVLSGFCLYWPFVKGVGRREPTLWEFTRKRCRRILPPYYAVLVLFAGLPLLQALHHHLPFDKHFTLIWLGLHLVMLHNLRPAYIISINGSLWSLALEFQLYILFPVLVEAYRRFPARLVLLIVFAFCTGWRCVVWSLGPLDDAQSLVLADSVFGRCFEFALGMFTALALATRLQTGISILGRLDAAFAGAVVAGALAQHAPLGPLTDGAWGLVFAGLLWGASRAGSAFYGVLSGRVLVRLGIFSYSVYLVHLPLVMTLGAFSKAHFSNTGQVLFMLCGTAPLMIGLGYLFFLLFEKPFIGTSAQKLK